MINFDCITNEDIKDHNLNWPENLDHPYRSLIIGSSGSGNPNALLKGCIHHIFNSLFSPSKRALFANTKGPGTSFQAGVSADFFWWNYFFWIWHKLAKFHWQTVFTSHVI